MVADCLEEGVPFGVVLIRDGDEAGDPDAMPYDVGTTAEIGDVTPLDQGRYYINTVGRRRFRIDRVVDRDPYLVGYVTYFEEEDVDEPEVVERLVEEIRSVFRDYL